MILFLYIFVMNILALNDMFNINCITDYVKNVKEDQMTAIPAKTWLRCGGKE